MEDLFTHGGPVHTWRTRFRSHMYTCLYNIQLLTLPYALPCPALPRPAPPRPIPPRPVPPRPVPPRLVPSFPASPCPAPTCPALNPTLPCYSPSTSIILTPTLTRTPTRSPTPTPTPIPTLPYLTLHKPHSLHPTHSV